VHYGGAKGDGASSTVPPEIGWARKGASKCNRLEIRNTVNRDSETRVLVIYDREAIAD